LTTSSSSSLFACPLCHHRYDKEKGDGSLEAHFIITHVLAPQQQARDPEALEKRRLSKRESYRKLWIKLRWREQQQQQKKKKKE
jgi:hypothetical protein